MESNKVSGSMKIIKYLLIAFNFVFFLCGIALIVTGTVILVGYREVLEFTGNVLGNGAILLIIVGVVIFLLGFFGCCGAWKENFCMIMIFATMLVVIFILELAVAIMGIIFKKKIELNVSTGMKKSMDKYGGDKNKGVTKAWDVWQKKMKCCGINKFSDWQNATVYNDADDVPDSCCISNSVGCGKGKSKSGEGIFAEGCINKTKLKIKESTLIMAIVAMLLAAIQLIGISFACCLGRHIRYEYEKVK
ncbi:hypothetical protein SNEBB_010831 [Seison nebaliae]|nr:hypothetical protein SNEBB_010831 [Seison nebaliae]